MLKVAYFLEGMYMGGTEKAFLTSLKYIDKSKYDVNLVLIDNSGILTSEVPSWCNISYLKIKNDDVYNSVIRNGFMNNFKYFLSKGRFFKAFSILIRRLFFGDLLAEINGKFEDIPDYGESFDVAISFQYHNTFITRYVAEKVKAKHKYVWLHNDLSTTKYRYSYTNNYIYNYDKIFCVSNVISLEAQKAYPTIKNRVITKYNCFDSEGIVNLSKIENNEIDSNVFSILTVGRLNYQKGYDIALNVAKKLLDNNIHFKWYIIGDGEEMNHLKQQSTKLGLDDVVFFLGSKKNPYSYMKQCTIYVQTSRHEGYCTTTYEALALNKCVITTNVSGATEQIDDGKNGWIVGINCDDIYKRISYLYNNQNEILRIEKVATTRPDNLNYFDFLKE